MAIRHRTGGYSLYELIITVSIAALVLSLGVPSFGKMLAEHRLKVEVDAVFHAVHLARKESIVRRREVTLCPSELQQRNRLVGRLDHVRQPRPGRARDTRSGGAAAAAILGEFT
jgi:Tfp pilus assembly protein FimT